MASNRHLGRIVAFQTLYEYDFRGGKASGLDPVEIAERNLQQYQDVLEDQKFVMAMIKGVLKSLSKLDKRIAPAAPEWPVEQIARVDKIVLRMAIFELILESDVPPKVVINEAVELAKSFGGENSSKFVNGVLGTIYRELDEQQSPSASKRKKPAKPSSKRRRKPTKK